MCVKLKFPYKRHAFLTAFYCVFIMFLMSKWTSSCQSYDYNDCNNYNMKPQSQASKKLFPHSGHLQIGMRAKKSTKQGGSCCNLPAPRMWKKLFRWFKCFLLRLQSQGQISYVQLSLLINTTWQLTISFLVISSLALKETWLKVVGILLNQADKFHWWHLPKKSILTQLWHKTTNKKKFLLIDHNTMTASEWFCSYDHLCDFSSSSFAQNLGWV